MSRRLHWIPQPIFNAPELDSDDELFDDIGQPSSRQIGASPVEIAIGDSPDPSPEEVAIGDTQASPALAPDAGSSSSSPDCSPSTSPQPPRPSDQIRVRPKHLGL
ncbi:unnamed protein product [Linum trigynum]|uniref:Uncharacterized protein n=1 Tax=Linum trigynum TaxID=586398 RepID=A0AAV2E0I5_9ROSI